MLRSEQLGGLVIPSGTLGRVGQLGGGQEEGLRACGIDGHGSPPEKGTTNCTYLP
jgi:hypothetical protein